MSIDSLKINFFFMKKHNQRQKFNWLRFELILFITYSINSFVFLDFYQCLYLFKHLGKNLWPLSFLSCKYSKEFMVDIIFAER